MPIDQERRQALIEALVASMVVTGLVIAAAVALPEKYIATGVGFTFLAATWLLVWRKDDATVRRFGLALGGLVVPGGSAGEIVKRALRSLAWALGFGAIVFVPFYFGWRAWWHVSGHFSIAFHPVEYANEVFGQVAIIALPEEAFYRGYLQTRLDDAWPSKVKILGAPVGVGLLVASAIFALGHLATIHAPARLAVFFPALVFGWLRARTGGIGAGVAFHALCNLFSEVLARGYGLY